MAKAPEFNGGFRSYFTENGSSNGAIATGKAGITLFMAVISALGLVLGAIDAANGGSFFGHIDNHTPAGWIVWPASVFAGVLTAVVLRLLRPSEIKWNEDDFGSAQPLLNSPINTSPKPTEKNQALKQQAPLGSDSVNAHNHNEEEDPFLIPIGSDLSEENYASLPEYEQMHQKHQKQFKDDQAMVYVYEVTPENNKYGHPIGSHWKCVVIAKKGGKMVCSSNCFSHKIQKDEIPIKKEELQQQLLSRGYTLRRQKA